MGVEKWIDVQPEQVGMIIWDSLFETHMRYVALDYK